MPRVLAILIAFCISMQPLVQRAMCLCVNGGPAGTATSQLAADRSTPSCCALAATALADASDTESAPAPMDPTWPCDDCDCALFCCGVSKAPITLSDGTIPMSPDTMTALLVLTEQTSAASAHVHRLKRPPKPSTTL